MDFKGELLRNRVIAGKRVRFIREYANRKRRSRELKRSIQQRLEQKEEESRQHETEVDREGWECVGLYKFRGEMVPVRVNGCSDCYAKPGIGTGNHKGHCPTCRREIL